MSVNLGVEWFSTFKDAGVPLEMAFPRAEYEARVARTRKSMEVAGIDVLLTLHTDNSCYLFDYETPVSNWYACFILPQEGEPIAQIPLSEISNLLIHGWDNENIYIFDWHQMGNDAPSQLAQILQERGLAEKTLGLEMSIPGWSAYTAQRLQELLPQVRIKDASKLVLDLRAVKSPAELAHMHKAAKFTDIGMQAAFAEVAPGKTDNDLAAAAYQAMVDAGSEHPSVEPLVYIGHVTSMNHVTPKRRVIKPGDPIYVSLTGVYERYSAPVVRTAVLGQPSDLVKRLADYDISTIGLVLENVRPGRTAADVARSVNQARKPMESQTGKLNFGYGYAIGLSLPPDWTEPSLYIDEGNDRVLEEGMAFHTVLAVRVYGKVGIGFSESWVVTATGCETFSKLPLQLSVV